MGINNSFYTIIFAITLILIIFIYILYVYDNPPFIINVETDILLYDRDKTNIICNIKTNKKVDIKVGKDFFNGTKILITNPYETENTISFENIDSKSNAQIPGNKSVMMIKENNKWKLTKFSNSTI